MTIFELLDHLESEIVSLRARNRELQLALQQAQSNPNPYPKKRSAKKKAKGVRKAVKKGAKKTQTTANPQPPTQLPLTQQGEETRTVGKRQALGRSIVQLRRASATTAI